MVRAYYILLFGLRSDRGVGNARDAHFENENGHDIHDYIKHTRNGKENQRSDRIAGRTENRRPEIIQQIANIMKFAVPLMATGVLQLLFSTADMVVVGSFVGMTELAAVGATPA